MIIHTLWAARKGESTPELLVAWDEYTLDNSWSGGFDEECDKAIKAMGSDLDEKRYIDIHVSEHRIMEAFNAFYVPGAIDTT
jgi:hypothetical protein